ncbi:MAG: peptidylprolyl isomerase [Anaerolineales bacterium]
MPEKPTIPLLVALFGLLLASCGGPLTPAATATPPEPTATPIPPTPTSLPAAALVNGQPILMMDYQAELERYRQAQAALGTELATNDKAEQVVLEALIDLELLAQEASRRGTELTDEALSQEIDRLTEAAGTSENAGAWMAQQGYDLASLRRAVRRQFLAQQTVQRLADEVPAELEQVQARHILVSDRDLAESLRQQLEEGADFGELALEYSMDLSTRIDGGNLGWFPKGVLTQETVEEAAFELEPGQLSPVIESDLGYHLVEVQDRSLRQLTANDWRTLRQQAVEQWVQETRQEASVEILIEF